jgi:hypothetical protein
LKIYLPNTSYACYVVQNDGIIRAYEQTPNYNTVINYRDYYIDSDYIYRDGVQQFGTYSTLPVCLDSSVITNEIYYRHDIDSILLIFLIFFIFVIALPYKIMSRAFGRWLKI